MIVYQKIQENRLSLLILLTDRICFDRRLGKQMFGRLKKKKKVIINIEITK